MVCKEHIDALVTAALEVYDRGPLSWFVRPMTKEEQADAYEVGEPWGAEGPSIAELLRRVATSEEADRIGQMLMRENRLSVNHRYGESQVEGIYAYGLRRPDGKVRQVVILKGLDAYEYQSCEHPGWETSEAFAFCQALRRRMIRRLPGYDQAPWEIHAREQYVQSGPEGGDESC